MSRADLDLPTIHKDARTSFVDQITLHYRRAIEQGRYRAGDRLPTIRAVASATGVTRTTVQQAYGRLARLGLVAATVGRGTEVSPRADAPKRVLSQAAAAAWQHLQGLAQRASAADGAVEFNFADLLPDSELFPVDDFRASIDRVLRQRGNEILAYGNPSGSRELREELARRGGDAHGCPDLSADDILITSGAQQGIDLVLRTFCSPGDAVAMALPTYHQVFGVLRAHGLELAPVASGPLGIDFDDLERVLAKPPVRLVYVMPTFHNPTGRTMSEADRRRFVELVGRSSVPVLEDEFECELRFAGKPLPSLQSLDERGLTVGVRSFSKGLFPGVRIGWVQASPSILNPMAALKRFADLESSPLMQAALFAFIQSGAMDRHLEMMRRTLRERHLAARAALGEHMPPGTRWTEPEGGLCLLVELPHGLDGDRVVARALVAGVSATPGRVFDPLDRPGNHLRLSLSRVAADRIAEGIAILGRCAAEEAAANTALCEASPPLFF